ncbi:MAG: hypothetical protein Q8936_06545 [Bacillota bacterium]|nr:hypothetical protein [Bacillota bacterium]
MSKSNEELATEITVAWLNAVGNACSTGQFNGSWLEVKVISDVYQTAYNTISNSDKNTEK